MKTIISAAIALLFFGVGLRAAAVEALPQLRGVLFAGSDKKFSLCNATGAESAWVSLGEAYAGWKLESYDAKSEVLKLRQGERQAEVRMATSKVLEAEAKKGTPATLADAQDLMRKMNLDQMVDRLMEQQKKMGIQVSKQIVSRMGGSAQEANDMEALQTKMLEAMFPKETVDAMKQDITRIYGEVFTKEELQGLADFYCTDIGKAMVSKQPDIQQKMAESMMPRIQQNMAKVQQITREFAAEIKARKAAGKSSPGGGGQP